LRVIQQGKGKGGRKLKKKRKQGARVSWYRRKRRFIPI